MPDRLDVALIIGIDRYHHLPELDAQSCGAVQNAINVEKWFRRSCQAINSTPNVTTLLSREGTTNLSNIFDKVQEVCSTLSRPGSRILFYYSGHGVVTRDYRDVLLCEDSSHDSGGILLNPLLTYFGFFPFDKQIFVIDSCRDRDEQMDGVSILAKRKHPPTQQLHQRMILRSTTLGYQAFGDSELLKEEETFPPVAYCTAGLLQAADGMLPKTLRRINEHAALCLYIDSLRGSLNKFLREKGVSYGQVPEITDDGRKRTWHAPISFVRLPLPEQDPPAGRPLFEEPEDYHQFVHAIVSQLGFELQRDRLMEIVQRKDGRCRALFLAPVDHAAVDWLVKEVLFGGSSLPSSDFRKVDLTALDTIPTYLHFLESACRTFKVDDEDSLRTKLTSQQIAKDTVLCVVLEETSAKTVLQQILDQFWTPTAQRYEEQRPRHRLYLLILTRNNLARTVMDGQPAADALPSLEPISSEKVEQWMYRFRHELPLPLIRKREQVAKDILPQARRYEGVVMDLCTQLSVVPPWST